MGDVEEKLKDYEVKREGEAEILMLKSNSVFNPVQVHNRDMSIAVLRTFVAKCKQEHEEMVSKRNKSHQKVSQDMPPGSDGDGALTSQDDENNGDHEKELNQAADKAEDLSKETTQTPSWKRTRELKPPIVLDALAASGLRSLRYACEVDGLGKVVALDNDKASVEACKRNIKFNGAAASGKVEAHLADEFTCLLIQKNLMWLILTPTGHLQYSSTLLNKLLLMEFC